MKFISSIFSIFSLVVFLLTGMFLIFSCSDSNQKNGFRLTPHLISPDEIIMGGPQKDGIPSIDEPVFVSPSQSLLLDDEWILGVASVGEAKAYPLKIMNWHEVVNDTIGNTPITVTYSPLTRTGLVFLARMKTDLNNIYPETFSFGVSGLLYNNNLLFYDRETESLWSQMMGKAVTGTLSGYQLSSLPSTIMTWQNWKTQYPQTLVLTPPKNSTRNYESEPNPNYHQSKKILFPVTHAIDDRLSAKEVIFGVTVNNQSKAYPLSHMMKLSQNSQGKVIFSDYIGVTPLMINWDKEKQILQIFDERGEQFEQMSSYWFAWYAFHPNTEIYKPPRQ